MRTGRVPELPDETPWVETRAGGLFFLNAVLVAPIGLVLVPVAIRALLRLAGVPDRPSAFLDPVPAVAAHVAPWAGWLFAIPLALVLRNLTVVDRPGPRAALVVFLLAHLAVLVWTASLWIR